MNTQKKLIIFTIFFTLPIIYYRLKVFLNNGKIPLIREITGLTFHHYHLGLIIILFASLLIIFHKTNFFSIALLSLGIGTSFDSFISRLFSFQSIRTNEIASYNSSFIPTLLLFANIILLAILFNTNQKTKSH